MPDLCRQSALLVAALLLLLSLPPGRSALLTVRRDIATDPQAHPSSPPPYNNTLKTTKVAVKIEHLNVRGYSQPHPELCPEQGARVQLVILVTSAPAHASSRDAIRLTWGHYGARSDVTVAFVLGAPPDYLEASIAREDEIYGDLIIGHCMDTYSNLTLKSLSILEWVHTYCPRAHRLLKTDDDVFINVPRLIQFASSSAWGDAKRTIWGRLAHKWLPGRERQGKYYVPHEEFPGVVFPDHVTGPAYLLTVDCVRPLLVAAASERYMRLEDVFITGILAKRLIIRRINSPEFYNRKIGRHPCAIQLLISVHRVQYHEQFDLWSKLLDGKNHCINNETWPP